MSYELYEMYKQEWIAKHPTATHEQYQKAMQEIAKRLGI